MRTDQINVILLIALISWGTAQILKTLIHFIKTKNFKAERLTGAGGMPSAHSATVCATAITTCRVCGICSPEFALAMILAMVVMYDAMGVRRSAGLQAKEINRLRRVVNELDEAADIVHLLFAGALCIDVVLRRKAAVIAAVHAGLDGLGRVFAGIVDLINEMHGDLSGV